ncbi:BlaI/MecI/CopY family transcriptional regulator [Nocardiopsis composta]|uniref:Putative transcriptional regulator n=1 Tax=Nocardiopsis composta TaxID=157465 RepID=A0A7W8QS67_9ACTN|nr:BlaI/MecI/CopY family transcriptional regulator [Nocardiopsis composta]MBB5434883.1 putative transcriptional regulator [Nocardiopsis composta]
MKEFGELEAAIMDALWDADRALAVREIRATMDYGRDVAYTTVMTVTNILFHKGLLGREKSGRAWHYRPVRTRAEHAARRMGEVFSGCGDPGATMRRFVEEISDEDRARLLDALTELTGLRPADRAAAVGD